jgi:subtilisin family serine protease
VTAEGTSLAAPMVAGAAAWLWTPRRDLDGTQVVEILRRSARDSGAPGRDNATGFGVLDIPRALAAPAPIPDR